MQGEGRRRIQAPALCGFVKLCEMAGQIGSFAACVFRVEIVMPARLRYPADKALVASTALKRLESEGFARA